MTENKKEIVKDKIKKIRDQDIPYLIRSSWYGACDTVLNLALEERDLYARKLIKGKRSLNPAEAIHIAKERWAPTITLLEKYTQKAKASFDEEYPKN